MPSIKYWNTVAWVDIGAVKWWDTNQWVVGTPKYWNGSAWVEILVTETEGVVNLDGQAITETRTSNCYAGVRFNSDGTVDQYKGQTGYVQIDSATDWIIPNAAAADDTYEIYATWTGDSLSVGSGNLNSWIDLDTSPEFRVQDLSDDGAEVSGTLLVDIRKNGGSNLFTNVSYTLSADKLGL